jgi:protein-S-isoprenylcysteine O-methyltransferase Ste14
MAYGLFCYGTFLATSAYALGFVGNYWAVFGWQAGWLRSLDGGPSAPLGEAVLVDVLLVTLFGLQHSVMARRGYKQWSARFIPEKLERSTYVLATSACLAVLFWQWRPIGVVVYDATSSALGYGLVGVSFVGWTIVVLSTFLIDHAELFGLRQSFAGVSDDPEAHVDFKTPGLYKLVRHPLYFGFLLAFWASATMTVGHLLFAVSFTLYVLVAIPLEERDLLERFGDRYRDYRKRVRSLLPFPRS